MSQSPLQYARKLEDTSVRIDGLSVGTRTLIFGNHNPLSPSCEGFSDSAPSGLICIRDTSAPQYTRFASPTSDTDRCTASDESEDSESCSAYKKFSILVRRDASESWSGGSCGTSTLAADEYCLNTMQVHGWWGGPTTDWKNRYLARTTWGSAEDEAISFCEEAGFFGGGRVVWPGGDKDHIYSFNAFSAGRDYDGIYGTHIADNLDVQREVVCW